jgi:isocitrate/isopropylmalate dehydrogenase
MDILIIPGDGIGPEITAATTEALQALDARFALGLRLREAEAGLASLERHGTTLRDEVMEAALAADGVVLGPMSTQEYPAPEKGGVPVPATFRRRLDLFANIRPSYVRPGVPSVGCAMDLVFARETLEEFYADRNMAVGSGELMPTEDVALAVGKITAPACRRITRVACELARRRRRRVTIVHKANALRIFQGLFLREARSTAEAFPDVEVDEVIVDAMAALLIRSPERFDVVLTTNMFGDILSDEAAELSGGLGLGGSLNHGDRHAVAQAAHGSAPDIAGQDRANPTALMQSSAMLLDHLGMRHDRSELVDAARCLKESVDGLLAEPATRTPDLGGRLGTRAFGRAVAAG